MGLTQPATRAYPVELLAQNFYLSGQFVPLGDPLSFVNDPQRGTLMLEEATATPLRTDWRIGETSKPRLLVPKEQVQIVLIGDLDSENDMHLFPNTKRLIVYTNTYAINGHFHVGSEVPVGDMFHGTGGPFFPATRAEVYSILPLTNAVGGAAPMMFVNRNHVELYHEKVTNGSSVMDVELAG